MRAFIKKKKKKKSLHRLPKQNITKQCKMNFSLEILWICSLESSLNCALICDTCLPNLITWVFVLGSFSSSSPFIIRSPTSADKTLETAVTSESLLSYIHGHLNYYYYYYDYHLTCTSGKKGEMKFVRLICQWKLKHSTILVYRHHCDVFYFSFLRLFFPQHNHKNTCSLVMSLHNQTSLTQQQL